MRKCKTCHFLDKDKLLCVLFKQYAHPSGTCKFHLERGARE